MPIQNPQTTYNQYVAVRDDLLTGKIASYTIGDRTVTLQNMKDLDDLIQRYANLIVTIEGGPIYADLSGIAHTPPWPEG